MSTNIRALIVDSILEKNHECLNILFEDNYAIEFVQEVRDTSLDVILDYLLDSDVKFKKAEHYMFHSLMIRLRLNKKELPYIIDKLELVMEKIMILGSTPMMFVINDYFNNYSPSSSMKILSAEARIKKFAMNDRYLEGAYGCK